MKYEAVFGNQELFNETGTFTGLDVVVHSIARGIKSYARSSDLTPESLRNYPVCAMRRIIQEPKRWTVEDQKAGRLPEVGAEVKFNFYQSSVVRQGVIKYIDDQVAVIQAEDVTRPFCYETCKVVFTPLETPEEKAERLRSEWINEAINAVRKTDVNGYESIYDALLSGELSVPTKGGE